jgi:hypothetical protein
MCNEHGHGLLYVHVHVRVPVHACLYVHVKSKILFNMNIKTDMDWWLFLGLILSRIGRF